MWMLLTNRIADYQNCMSELYVVRSKRYLIPTVPTVPTTDSTVVVDKRFQILKRYLDWYELAK